MRKACARAPRACARRVCAGRLHAGGCAREAEGAGGGATGGLLGCEQVANELYERVGSAQSFSKNFVSHFCESGEGVKRSQIVISVANLLVERISMTYIKGRGVLKASPAISFHIYEPPASA